MKGDPVCEMFREDVGEKEKKDSQLMKYDIITPIATYKYHQRP